MRYAAVCVALLVSAICFIAAVALEAGLVDGILASSFAIWAWIMACLWVRDVLVEENSDDI